MGFRGLGLRGWNIKGFGLEMSAWRLVLSVLELHQLRFSGEPHVLWHCAQQLWYACTHHLPFPYITLYTHYITLIKSPTCPFFETNLYTPALCHGEAATVPRFPVPSLTGSLRFLGCRV